MLRLRKSLRSLRARLRESTRYWLSDAPADLAEALAGPAVGRPLPGRALRQGVARGSSRDEYLKAGGLAATEVLAFLLRSGVDGRPLRRWLDFGCGSGRLAWLLHDSGAAPELVGVDVDRGAVDWCARHLAPGRFRAIEPMPPLGIGDGEIDLALAASVFTHFDEREQDAWLDELRRVIRPGGYLVASTHGPAATALRPELGRSALELLAATGFLHVAGDGRFNDRSTFHSRAGLERDWGTRFELVRHEEARLFRFQDLSLWRRPDARSE
jgi:SAM-dependent methyltransferase